MVTENQLRGLLECWKGMLLYRHPGEGIGIKSIDDKMQHEKKIIEAQIQVMLWVLNTDRVGG